MNRDVVEQVRLLAPEVEAPSEFQIARQRAKLTNAVRAESASAGIGASSAPRRKRRFRRWVPLSAAAVLVAAACGALLAASSGAPRTGHAAARARGAGGTSRPTTPTTPTRARLVAKATAALDAVSGDISYSQSVSAAGWTYDEWDSPDGSVSHTTSYAPGGAEDYDSTVTQSATQLSATVVYYPARAWWSYTEATPSMTDPNCKLPTCGDVANGGLPPGPTNNGVPVSAAGVKWLLNNPVSPYTMMSGTQVVDGVDTYEITESFGGSGTRSFWIDQDTNLPVQEQTSGSTNPDNNQTTEISWLPSTSANLALLQVSPPAGFTHTSLERGRQLISATPVTPTTAPTSTSMPTTPPPATSPAATSGSGAGTGTQPTSTTAPPSTSTSQPATPTAPPATEPAGTSGSGAAPPPSGTGSDA